MRILQGEQITVSFGGIDAIKNFTFHVNTGEIVGIIGPNGAGKTTLFNCITGFNKPSGGVITLSGSNITGMLPNKIASKGLARTFQSLNNFSSMTVLESILVAQHCTLSYNIFSSIFHLPSYVNAEKLAYKKAYEILNGLDLWERRDDLVLSLSYGMQKRVDLARSLALDPDVLLLDEPVAGMHSAEKQSLVQLLDKLHKEQGLSILLIEHDVSFVMGICDRIYALNYGQKIAEGYPEEVQKDPEVLRAYLGEDEYAFST